MIERGDGHGGENARAGSDDCIERLRWPLPPQKDGMVSWSGKGRKVTHQRA